MLLDPSLPWSQLLAPERERRPLWGLGPGHRLLRDELAHLLAGLVDARSGAPVWWPAVHACALGATAIASAAGAGAADHDGSRPDVRLPDGRPAWVDAGPRAPLVGWPEGARRVHVESVRLAGTLGVERDAPPTERLSDEQRAAVTHGAGPARVLAPAGSGKTRVLAARLRHLVRDRGVQPRLITALAYNTRAAQELAERTRDVVAGGVRPAVSTVHALGLAVCTAALGRRPVVLDTDTTVAALREACAGGPRGGRRAGPRIGVAGGPPVDAVLAALTDVRLGLRDPAQVEAERGDVPGFAALVPRYRALLHARGWLDFDEQVHLAVALLLADPSLRARVQRTTTHLLVDEAQDLTPVLVLLVRLLAGPAQQLFAVGDDDQTIYGYAGATPRVLVDLPDAYHGTTTYPLTVNHRCPPDVVRGASALLAHNTVRVTKEVRPAAAPGSGVQAHGAAQGMEVLDAPTGAATHAAVTRLRALLAEHGPDDVAVLARVGATLLAPQFALAVAGVPVRPHVGPEVLVRTGLRTALAYLRIAVSPDRIRPEDLADTLRRPARRLTGVVDGEHRATSLAAPDEAAVVAALRTWRRDRAATDRVPAFLVAHDRTLADLARRRPQDLRALRACHGIGPARVERYGDELLALLRAGAGS